MAQALAGLILGGGIGERFGGPKAFARLPDGTTFLERCLDVLRVAGAAPVAATLPPGTVEPHLDGLLALPLAAPGADMLASVRHGLSRLLETTGWTVVAVLPVDHPLVRPDTVRALAAAVAPTAVPVYRGKRGHPVALARGVAARIVSGELPAATLRDAMKAAGRRDVEVDDTGILGNCNTPEQLAAALAGSR
jgi:CTP:molybdopterin cytidylyltransferase MocA